MKNLWQSVLLLLVSALLPMVAIPASGQQVAWLNAPAPATVSADAFSSSLLPEGTASSSSLPGASASAIMPVERRPAPESQQRFSRTDWALMSTAAALRFLDYKSTVKAMSDPANFREDQLPNALVHCRPGLGAFEAGMVAGNYYAYRLFVEHRHRKLARWGQVVNLAGIGWTVGHNYYELNQFWPRATLLRPGSTSHP